MKRSLLRFTLLASALSCFALFLSGCGVEGTYKDETGAVTLELKSGGKAVYSGMGQSAECTYKVDGDRVPVTCMGFTVDFTKQKDGSLTPGPDARFGALKKQ